MKRFFIPLIIILFLLTVSVNSVVAVSYAWMGGNGEITLPYSLEGLASQCLLATYNSMEDRIEGCNGESESVWAVVTIEFPVDTVISAVSVGFQWNGTRSGGSSFPASAMYYRFNGNTENDAYHQRTQEGPASHNLQWTGTPFEIETLEIVILARNDDPGDGSYAYITSISITEPQIEVYRPLSSGDEVNSDFIGLYDVNAGGVGAENLLNAHQVVHFSDEPLDPVYSAVSGIVTENRPANSGDCQKHFGHGDCKFALDVNLLTGGIGEVYAYLALWYTDSSLTSFQYNIVTIYNYDLNVSFTYFLLNPTVKTGDTIAGGCILGYTGPVLDVTGYGTQFLIDLVPILDVTVYEYDSWIYGMVAVTVQRFGDPENYDLTQILSVYPSGDTPCSNENLPCGLVENPTFQRNAQGWLGDFQQVGGFGVLLNNGQEVYKFFDLDESSAISLSVEVEQWASTSTGAVHGVQLFIDDEESPIYTVGGRSVYTLNIPAETLADGAHRVGVRGTWAGVVRITRMCLNGSAPISSCYFNNPAFDYGLSGWENAGAVHDSVNTEGYVMVTNDPIAYLSQEITLYPVDESTPQEYQLTVILNGWTPQSPSFSYDVEYVEVTRLYTTEFDLSNTGEAIQVDDVYIYEETFTIDEETTEQFTFTFELFEAGAVAVPSGVGQAWVTRICLEPTDGNYAGYTPPPLFGEQCEKISPNDTNDILNQIRWLWRKMDNFFQCDLMIVLNRIYSTVLDTYNLAVHQTKYSILTAHIWSNWLADIFFPYLSGHFYNIATGTVTTITVNEGGQSCNNLFCLFTSLFGAGENIFDSFADIIKTGLTEVLAPLTNALIALLNRTVNFFFSLLELFLSFGLMLIVRLFEFLDIARDWLFLLIDTWNNATPAQIPGLPDCQSNPQDGGFCIALWFLEHTIFSSRGALLIPLMIGLGSLRLVLWAFIDARRTILTVGRQF